MLTDKPAQIAWMPGQIDSTPSPTLVGLLDCLHSSPAGRPAHLPSHEAALTHRACTVCNSA